MAKFEFLARTNDNTTRNFDLEKTIILFLDDKKLQKRSEKTIKTYRVALAHYTKYCNDHDLNGNEQDCVRQYIHYMTFEKVKWDDHPTNISTTVGVSPRSINNAIRFIRVFYNWAVSKKYINHNPANDVGLQKENQESFEIFTDDEMESLLNSPRRRSYTGMRDYTMMVLMIDTGLRVGEMTNLVRGDFDLTYRQINIRAEISKSKRSRVVPISRTTANLLQDLFDYTNIVEDDTEECKDEIRGYNVYFSLSGEEGTFEAATRYAEEYSELTPGVTIEVEWVPGDYNAALNAALLTDEGPDVFEVQTVDVARVNAGQLAPLNDLFDDDVLADFSQTALDRVIVDDSIYSIPMIVDPQLIYYRKSALEEAGLEPPATIDELMAAAAALDSGRVKGLFLGNDQIGPPWITYVSAFASGAELLDGVEAAFNTDANVEMLTKRAELAQSGNLLVGAPTEWWDPTALNDGLTNMQWIGLWAAPTIIAAHGDDIGVVPWPALDEANEPVVWVGTWNESVNANSPNADAAKEYVKWLWIDNTDVQQDWSLSYGFHIPPRASAAASAEPLQSGIPLEIVKLTEQYGRSITPMWTGAMQSALRDAQAEVILNGADAVEQMNSAEETVQGELDALFGG